MQGGAQHQDGLSVLLSIHIYIMPTLMYITHLYIVPITILNTVYYVMYSVFDSNVILWRAMHVQTRVHAQQTNKVSQVL